MLWCVLGRPADGGESVAWGPEITATEKEIESDQKDLQDLGKGLEQSPAKDESIPPAVKQQAQEELNFAKLILKQADEAVQRARTAANSAAAQVELKDALDKAQQARRWAQRAKVRPIRPRRSSPHRGAGTATDVPIRPRSGGRLQFESETFQQLAGISRTSAASTARTGATFNSAPTRLPSIGTQTF